MKNKFKALLLLFAVVAGVKANAQSPVSQTAADILQNKLDSCVTAFNVPGMSATMLLPGNQYWKGASGLDDIYTMTPMDTSHLFYQASVTKMFVAAIIFQMIEEGLLALDDSVGEFLPPILTIPESTRIRYLLSHRSGLYNFIGENPLSTQTWSTDPDSIWTSQLAIETYSSSPIFSQGASFAYSNTNYIVLGMIIEQVTGNSFATELRNRIVIPYGLTQTFFPPVDSIAGDMITGWTSFVSLQGPYDTDASPILNDCSASMFFTAGALVSYPSDVAKFTRKLFSGEVIHDTLLTLMKTCTNINLGNSCNGYGYGAMRYVFAGKEYFGHAGDLSGFTQLTIHQEADSVTLTVSINRNNADRGPIALALLSALADVALSTVDRETNTQIVSIYPNPARNVINIGLANPDSRGYEIELFDQVGQIVYQNFVDRNARHFIIPLEQYAAGMYMLKVSNSETSISKKVIVQK